MSLEASLSSGLVTVCGGARWRACSNGVRAASTYCARDEHRKERETERSEVSECSNGERSEP